MPDDHRPMSFENIQSMRAAIDMVMQATSDAKPRVEVARFMTGLAIKHDVSASTLANLALEKMGLSHIAVGESDQCRV